jgi:CheY-like chemotaxis protein
MKPRLLVVDDEALIAAQFVDVAESCGYEARSVTRPSKAAGAVKSFRPDILLLDLVMPDLDGVELVGGVLPFDPDLGVVLVSALPQELMDAATRLGEARGLRMLGSLRKPVSAEALRAYLERVKPQRRRTQDSGVSPPLE